MAECIWSQLSVDWFGLETNRANVSDWRNGQDYHQDEGSSLITSESDHQKRSDIVHAIINNSSLDHLESILSSGRDVNETLRIPTHYKSYKRIPHYKTYEGDEDEDSDAYDYDLSAEVLVHHYTERTALGEAAIQEWTEGVRRFLAAGAKYKTPGVMLLTLALEKAHCPYEIIDLYLKHGADPNDHDGQFQNIPLLVAIHNVQTVEIVKLLLEHGANPNVIGEKGGGSKDCPLSAGLDEVFGVFGVFTALRKTLLQFGADVNYNIPGTFPLLHEMMTQNTSLIVCPLFPQEQLDVIFRHGGNINVQDGDYGTALEYAIRGNGHSNSIRWLIRHGADISTVNVTLLKRYFKSDGFSFSETPLILLQAGMRVSHGAQTQLSNMETAIAAWLQADTQEEQDICRTIHDMADQLVEEEERELQRMQGLVRKHTFPEYWTHQMDDLQEFSDKSLQIYPEEKQRHNLWQDLVDQIHTMVEFLRQPQSLQWYCRRCVRESLVSLQPSVVKKLPVPARLKPYILCHEI